MLFGFVLTVGFIVQSAVADTLKVGKTALSKSISLIDEVAFGAGSGGGSSSQKKADEAVGAQAAQQPSEVGGKSEAFGSAVTRYFRSWCAVEV